MLFRRVKIGGPPLFLPEADTITHLTSQRKRAAPAKKHSRHKAGNLSGYFLLIALAIALILPAPAGAAPDSSLQNTTGPQIVYIGTYVVDFNEFSVATGTYQANFYVTLRSDSPVSIEDLEIMNGHVTTIDTSSVTPNEKSYRIFAAMTADPNLRRYPFDRHVLPIIIEPKLKNEREMVFVIDQKSTGLDTEADLPGWEFSGTSGSITNKSYITDEVPYTRAVFDYGIGRDTASTLLKFFLPIMLIIIVSLSSLMMKVSSRLGLNASMFLAAVLIHWRVADAIPLVAYATFLDMFMIITYGTLVMVLLSGILIMKFTESKDTARVETVYFWSLRIIPVISIAAYCLLFLCLRT
jgi:hypothetical protein